MKRLREAANRLKTPDQADAFTFWADYCMERRRRRELAEHMRAEAGLASETLSLSETLKKRVDEYEARIAQMARDHELDLERQRVELTGSVEEVLAMRETREKEAHVEMLRRQSVRRMLNAGVANGFIAWTELWEAKSYAMGRLREVGNKLRSPELSQAFGSWAAVTREAKHAAERERREPHTVPTAPPHRYRYRPSPPPIATAPGAFQCSPCTAHAAASRACVLQASGWSGRPTRSRRS